MPPSKRRRDIYGRFVRQTDQPFRNLDKMSTSDPAAAVSSPSPASGTGTDSSPNALTPSSIVRDSVSSSPTLSSSMGTPTSSYDHGVATTCVDRSTNAANSSPATTELQRFFTTPSRAYWRKLPREIRLMVLEMVAEAHCFKTEPYARAGYAGVCREWQLFFEPLNFQRLVIDQDRLCNLQRFTSGPSQRRGWIKHLALSVKLDEYDCTVCQLQEDPETRTRNNDKFTAAVWDLLTILSTWPEHVGEQGGFTLELGAYSPSDSTHTFKDFHLERNYPYQEKSDTETDFDAYKLRAVRLEATSSLHDPYHGWIDGHRAEATLGSKLRLMGPLTFDANRSQIFPRVPIVTGLLIRRHFYRQIPIVLIRKLLHEACPSLSWFRHEGWHHINHKEQLRYERAYRRLMLDGLPTKLQDLSIFEDFNNCLCPDRSSERANRALGRAISQATRSLETFSAAFLIDAADFFADFWPDKLLDSDDIVPWKHLRKLALTSRLLHHKSRSRKVVKLLIAAGRAAAYMPKLEVMEIWNGGGGRACVFRYINDVEKPRITWSSNWGNHATRLPWEVVYNWDHGATALTAEVQRLPLKREGVKTYAPVLQYLELRRSVLHEISDYQIAWEEYICKH